MKFGPAAQLYHQELFSLNIPSAIYTVGFISKFQIEVFLSWWQQFQPLQFYNPVLGGIGKKLLVVSTHVLRFTLTEPTCVIFPSVNQSQGPGALKELIGQCSPAEVRGGLSFYGTSRLPKDTGGYEEWDSGK